MPAVCLYFQVHQPYRIKRYKIFDVGQNSDYFTDDTSTALNNSHILNKVAAKCYIPANTVLLELLSKYPTLKISYSLSGVLIEQLQQFAPHVLDSFRQLAKTGQVEFLSETYYHSLSFLYSKLEFTRQVRQHQLLISSVFNQKPKVFRNTELIYNNQLAAQVEKMGFTGILAEGADHVLGWRSPNYLYSPQGCKKIKLLLKNYRLSDDIAFRFSETSWVQYPLTADKFSSWISQINGNGEIVNLFMDYETFGEHQWVDTGIFEFLRHLPGEILKTSDNSFITPSEAVKKIKSVGVLNVPHFVSWADMERDLSAWLGNPIQDDAANKLYAMEKSILKTGDDRLISDWRKLQTSDHFYYMCTKWFADGDVHKYFNPYDSPYEAFISFMNVLLDLRLRLDTAHA